MAVAQLRAVRERDLGVLIDGRISYYLLFVVAVVLVLMLLRIVNSPFGRVLQAIRENEFRAEAIGYRVVVYRTTSSVLSALFACVAGAMLAVWLRYNGPDTSLVRDHDGLPAHRRHRRHGHDLRRGDRLGALSGRAKLSAGSAAWQRSRRQPAMAVALLSPDRWLLWLGLLFVLSVYYFPTGVVGRLRAAAARKP
jgi:branched-chain amino acid transport system permease protein